MPITAIIFDVGGVLNEGRPDFIQCFNEHGIALKDDLWVNEGCKQLIYDFCTGKYSPDEKSTKLFFEAICIQAAISEEISFELFKQAWNSAIVHLNHELINELSTLREQGYRLFILSDTNLLHREYLEELYQQASFNGTLSALFDKCYFSYETGNYKGFSGMEANQSWLQILSENHLQPHECLFVDDKLEYVDKAKSLGLSALHYKEGSTSQTLFDALEEIKTNDERSKLHFFSKAQLPFSDELIQHGLAPTKKGGF